MRGDDIIIIMFRFLKFFIFIIMLGSVITASYVFYYVIPIQIETTIKQHLGSLGFKKVTFASVEKQKGKLILHGISLDTKSFSGIESLTIRYTLWSYIFNQRRAESVEIKNLKLTGELSNDIVLSLAGWKNDGKLLTTLSDIPSKKIIFQNSSLELLVPAIGGLKFEYEGEIKQNESGELEIAGILNTGQKKLEGKTRISGTVNRKGNLEIQAQCENFKIETNNIMVRRANLLATLLASSDVISRMTLEASAGSVLWHNLPLQDANVTLEKNIDSIQIFAEGKTPGAKSTEFSAQISVSEDNSTLEATIYPESVLDLVNYLKKNHHINENELFPTPFLAIKKPIITIEGNSIFGENSEGFFKLIPESLDFEIAGNYAIDRKIKKTTGNFFLPRSFISVIFDKETLKTKKDAKKNPNNSNETQPNKNSFALSSNGNYSYDFALKEKPILNWTLQGKIDKSNMEIYGFPIKNIEGRLTLNSNSIGSFNKNSPKLSYQLPLNSKCTQYGEITLDLWNSDLPIVNNVNLSIFNGTVQTGPLKINTNSPPETIVVDIDNINLSDITQAMQLDATTVIGEAGGKLPIYIKEGHLFIKKGLFQSQQSGIIKIPPELSNSYFPGADPKMQAVRNIIKNFHFEFFEIRIDGPIDGLVMINILAKGINITDQGLELPADLDFKIEARLPEILNNFLSCPE